MDKALATDKQVIIIRIQGCNTSEDLKTELVALAGIGNSLICAAPDLLTALEELVIVCRPDIDTLDTFIKARAAIAKAKGRHHAHVDG